MFVIEKEHLVTFSFLWHYFCNSNIFSCCFVNVENYKEIHRLTQVTVACTTTRKKPSVWKPTQHSKISVSLSIEWRGPSSPLLPKLCPSTQRKLMLKLCDDSLHQCSVSPFLYSFLHKRNQTVCTTLHIFLWHQHMQV